MTERQFETMVRDYEKLVYTVCFQVVHDPQTAEDLMQDTFLSAWSHAAQCPADAVKPWLCRIALNKARDHLKSAYSRRGMEEPYRSVCVLYFGQGAPVEQIASTLGRTPKTVHTQLYRARKKLRQSLSVPCPA